MALAAGASRGWLSEHPREALYAGRSSHYEQRRWFIPVVIDSPEPSKSLAIASPVNARGRAVESSGLALAIVNNMPDSAFRDTERQFVALLDRVAGSVVLRVGLYTFPGLPRAEETQRYIDARYRTLGQLFAQDVDAAIVTGTEPLAETLPEEPYWHALETVIGWAEELTVSTVLSCLTAHAALLLFDGIERSPLGQKCSGVFAHDILVSHPLLEGMTGQVHVPHSRLNDVPAGKLPLTYSSVLGSPELSWTVLTRERRDCLFVLVQGHPEYSTSSLLREYKRDLLRHLRGVRAQAPSIPLHYLDAKGEQLLGRFAAQAAALPSPGMAMEAFPFDQARKCVVNSWRPDGEQLYANWLQEILRRKQSGASGARPVPRRITVAKDPETRSVGAR